MDWNTLLKKQQTDFITRFKSGHLLHCEAIGQHSEKTVISGDRLKKLRDFCWDMAEKYKQRSSVRATFINNLKGNLGEEVVKDRLGDLITDVNYEVRKGGDGKIDFTLTSNPNIGIQVKACHGEIDRVKWSITKEEVEKNAVLVCVLIREEVSEAESEYNLILAGFLPTQNIDASNGKAFFSIDELLYSGGLRCYLESFIDRASLDKENYLDYFELGNESLNSGNYQKAIEYYTDVIKLEPNDAANAYNNRGYTYLNLEEYQKALKDFTSAIKLDPNDAKAYYNRGYTLNKLGQYQKAIEDYTRAIKLNPNDAANAYNNRGNIFNKLGQYREAIQDYTDAIKLNPNYIIAYNNRGSTLNKLEEYQKAIEDYTRVIEINPNDAKAYYNRDFAFNNLEEYQKAIDDYTRAIKLNKNLFLTSFYYNNRGNAYLNLAEYQKAIDNYTSAITLDPNDAKAYFNRNFAINKLKEYQKAI